MKTLSIKSEYAYLVAAGIKDVENRTWQTKYRGKILIHASGKDLYIIPDHGILKTPLHHELSDGKEFSGTEKYLRLDNEKQEYYLAEESARKEYDLWGYGFDRDIAGKIPYPAQAIIGEVELVDIVKDSKSVWAEKGCYHWILFNAKLYDKPITQIKGKLNLWEFSQERR